MLCCRGDGDVEEPRLRVEAVQVGGEEALSHGNANAISRFVMCCVVLCCGYFPTHLLRCTVITAYTAYLNCVALLYRGHSLCVLLSNPYGRSCYHGHIQ